jgi:hypothetical protein
MSAPSPDDPLGYDCFVFDDMDPNGRDATGAELVEAAIVHRCTSRSLPLIGTPGGTVEFGEDVREWINESTTRSTLTAKGPLLAVVIQRDPRIEPTTLRVVVAIAEGVTFADGAHVDLTIDIDGQTVTGQAIDLVIGVSRVTVEILAQGR